MKRSLLPLMVIALTVAMASVAEAAAQRGVYKGQTNAADPIKFKVNKKGRVTAFTFDGVHLTCTDGDAFDTPTGNDKLSSPTGTTYKVRKRKFAVRVHEDEEGRGWDATGKFNRSGSKATGTIRVFARFGEGNNPDPEGETVCDSGKLAWSTTHG